MATRARNRIVVKSKSKSSMVTSNSSSTSEGSSEGPYIIPLTSTPTTNKERPIFQSPVTIADSPDPLNPLGLPNTTRPRSRTRIKSKGNKVKPLPITYPPPRPHSVAGNVLASRRKQQMESSSSEGDDVFFIQGDSRLTKTTPIHNNQSHNVRPMYLSTGQLLPSLYYSKPAIDNQFIRSRNKILPVLNVHSSPLSVSSQFHYSYLNSPSPTIDGNSTYPSSVSSPLPPLLIRSMRKGGTKPSALSSWQSDSILDSVLPGGIVKIFIGTWNMNEQKILPSCIDDFLLPSTQETAADIFVIGTQESTPNKQEWDILLQQTLGPTHVLIQSATLGVLYLDVFLRRDLIWYCSDVQSSSYATRPINVIKTKGGVAIHLTLFGSTLLFISSHLSAGTGKCVERNSDVQRILNNIHFNNTNKKSLMESHDFIFWCGDLNYRLELNKTTAENYIKNSDWMSLLLKDQLTREMLSDKVYHGFSEQPIVFPPSYKFDVNSNNYDTSEKSRTPSWTDRVLFRSCKGGVVVGCGYCSCDSLKSSDHRPVFALFNAELKPLEEIDGVPSNPAGYNRDLYTKAMRRRKKVALTSIDLLQQKSNSNVQDRPTSLPHQSNTRHTSSTVCTIL